MPGVPQISVEGDRARIKRYVAAFNRGDIEGAAGCFSRDACHLGRWVGRLGVRRILQDIRGTFPDAILETIDVVAAGDQVVEHGYFSGTHTGIAKLSVNGGWLVGAPPTNRQFLVHHVHICRVKDSEIVDHFGMRDDIGMMQQLGLLPAASESTV